MPVLQCPSAPSIQYPMTDAFSNCFPLCWVAAHIRAQRPLTLRLTDPHNISCPNHALIRLPRLNIVLAITNPLVAGGVP